MRRKKSASSLLFLIFFIASIAGVVYIYNSKAFERTMPVVEAESEIYWNLKEAIKINISDESGIRHYRVVMQNNNEKRILDEGSFNETEMQTELALEIKYPKIGGYLKTSQATLFIEVTDGSSWDFFSGNKFLTKRAIIIDQRRPLVSVVDHSYGISKGGAALVIFQAKDENLENLYIETNYGKKFKPQPFFQEGYYISLVAWPIMEERFNATVVAVDKAGNKSRDTVQFEKRRRHYRPSTIKVSDSFLEGKIAELSHDFEETRDLESHLEQFKMINEHVRLENEKRIHEITSVVPDTTISSFRVTPFYPLKNGAAVASFGTKRFYKYKGKRVSTSYHLGIDYASVKMADIKTQNAGEVVFAQPNGIYGNLPILHHGMGLYTLYGHCSSLQVVEGDKVKQNAHIANTGKSGLALGDHLHFGVLVQGIEVRPAEWMDREWIAKNITRIITRAKNTILGT
jgi:murein DD-endopeptidase MepM/ murein hydrolase activator NlpD